MNESSELALYLKVLNLRTHFKAISQISWNISSLQKRYPIKSANKKQLIMLQAEYVKYVDWLEETIKKIKGE